MKRDDLENEIVTQAFRAIAALTAQRDRLRRYVRALAALDVELDSETPVAAAQFAAQIEEMHAARYALIEAGDLEDDHE